jgi:hypothetical protein
VRVEPVHIFVTGFHTSEWATMAFNARQRPTGIVKECGPDIGVEGDGRRRDMRVDQRAAR